jgi:hypothetical protein
MRQSAELGNTGYEEKPMGLTLPSALPTAEIKQIFNFSQAAATP